MMVDLISNINILQKSSHVHKKDGSSIKSKSSMLEKAIRELEKMVAECKFYYFSDIFVLLFVLSDTLGLFQFSPYSFF